MLKDIRNEAELHDHDSDKLPTSQLLQTFTAVILPVCHNQAWKLANMNKYLSIATIITIVLLTNKRVI